MRKRGTPVENGGRERILRWPRGSKQLEPERKKVAVWMDHCVTTRKENSPHITGAEWHKRQQPGCGRMTGISSYSSVHSGHNLITHKEHSRECPAVSS